MNYFDDLHFVAADILEHYSDTIDKCYTDIYTVEFILNGAMFHGIDSGAPEKINTPAVFWHHPAHRYHYGPLPPAGEWHHHWVSFRGARARRLLENGFMKLSPRGFVPVAHPLAVARIFQMLLEKTSQPLPQAQAEAVVLLEQLLCLLMEQTRGVEEPYSDRITALCDAVQDEPCRAIDFEKEARAMGLSYSHFRRLFRQRTGRPPHDYLLYCRMQSAADALKDRRRSIKEIAMDTGYEDPAQFTKLFRQKTGLSPRQFRQALPAGE
jgi:AraC-like DNA-binding protein